MDQKKKAHVDNSDSVRADVKDDENKNVMGKFEDKTNSLPITEFVALNQKCYSFKHLKKDDTKSKTKKSKRCFKLCGKSSDNAWQLYGYDVNE